MSDKLAGDGEDNVTVSAQAWYEKEQEIADWKSDYDTLLNKLYQKDQHIADLEQALAEKEQRETTFTDFLQRYIDYWQHKPGGHADTREQAGKFIYEQWCELNAIDGGALEKDGEK